MADSHPHADPAHAPRAYTLALLPLDDLTPEQAPWVIAPLFTWAAIQTPAQIALCHLRTHEPSRVDPHALSACMTSVLGPHWQRTPLRDERILRNQLAMLDAAIRRGKWVALARYSASFMLVDWAEGPDLPDEGGWQVNRYGQSSGMGGALQWRLDEVYRQRRMRARRAGLAQEPVPASRIRLPDAVRRRQHLAAPPAKAERWRQRQALVAAGVASPDAKVRAAAQRLGRNNVGVEKARLSDHVYDPSRPVPEGWRNVGGDQGALATHGLKPEDLLVEGTNFRAQVYDPDPVFFGNDMNPTVAFKGTEMTSLQDWSANFSQALGMESSYYEQAVKIGEKLRNDVIPIDITGHSLGGGLCSAASSASGKDCWSFNAAGLHPQTVERYGGVSQLSNVHAYHVRGDILTVLQRIMPLPEAAGTPYPLPGHGTPIGRHFISQAISGIEKQKDEDISMLRELAP